MNLIYHATARGGRAGEAGKSLTPGRGELQVKIRNWSTSFGFGERLSDFFRGLGQEIYFFSFEEAVAAARDALDAERAQAEAHYFLHGMMLAEEDVAERFEFGALHDELIPVVGAVAAGGFGLTNGF